MGFRRITAQLKLRTPLHVGTGKATEAVDDLLRRDAQGRILIPGTALAGPLRAVATRLAPRLGSQPCRALEGGVPGSQACQCLTCQLFGDVNPQEGSDDGVASRLIIYDAPLAQNPETAICDGVGIDRVTGAAARMERLKFDLEVVPAETTFSLRIELDPDLTNEKALQLLAASLSEWEAGRGVVGGRGGRGLGAFALQAVCFHDQKLDTVDSLIDFLKDGPDWSGNGGDAGWLKAKSDAARAFVQPRSESHSLPVASSWVLAEFTLAADGPFLINDSVRAGQGGFDHAPLLAAYQRGSDPILPGSSLRGVLRSQAERIARTLATYAAWGDDKRTNDERKQKFYTICPACNPLTAKTSDAVASCNSFIKTLTSEERRTLEETGAEEKLCLACRLFGSTWNGSRLRVEDAYLLPGTGEQKVMDFLAIDRFTGGGLDGAKFDAVVLWKPHFRTRLFLENPEGWELGWLALTLRDLHEGLATVGFGAAKGFGRMSIHSPAITIGILHPTDFPSLPAPEQVSQNKETLEKALIAWRKLLAQTGRPSGLYQTIPYAESHRADWLALADGWVHAFHHQLKARPSAQEFPLQADSYFRTVEGQWLSDLYPVEVS
jgi:CRISPR/Cas system CSM-associated protein Csm3 (group 7 of RAMP superfamily)